MFFAIVLGFCAFSIKTKKHRVQLFFFWEKEMKYIKEENPSVKRYKYQVEKTPSRLQEQDYF
jgi:hypothetical protein